MKSALQQRAESLAIDFKKAGRKPVVIEFSGSPKAGKTTTLATVHSFLKRCGFKVETVIERASVCPIRDKHHSNFNIWTACTTLAQLLERTQHQQQESPHPDAPEILILDRGLFDSIVWLARMHRLAHLTVEELKTAQRFLLIADWRRRITAVIVMTTSPEDSMAREKGDLEMEGLKGSIMNEDWLRGFRDTVTETCNTMRNEFQIFQIDTSQATGMNRKKTAEKVCDLILDVVSEQLEENILCAPRREITAHFGGGDCVQKEGARAIVETFHQKGFFVPRTRAEESGDNVQALPIVVIRTKGGRVLQLRRREKEARNPLHERLVIWAGGHVRKEDADNGHSVSRGAARELDEELRLKVEPSALELIGAIYSNLSERTGKHVAIVYQWTAPNEDVDIVLSGPEFFERRGNSLSGRFVELAQWAEEASSRQSSVEPWSEVIIRRLLPSGALQERLF